MKPEVVLALNESVENAMGVYPKSCNGVLRTEWQEGWNAYGDELLESKSKAYGWFEGLPVWKQDMISEMLIKEDVRVGFGKDGVILTFSASDLFAWGYSDFEEITDDDMLKSLYAVWLVHGGSGMCIWWCKHMKEKPQWPVEKQWRLDGLWDVELESLPDCGYDERIGRWSKSSKADIIAQLNIPK